MNRIPVAILGGSGYGGGELLRLLGSHPGARVVQVSSRHHAGRPVSAVHRHLAGLCNLTFQVALDLEGLLSEGPAFLISALPNGQSADALQALLEGAPEAAHSGKGSEGPRNAATGGPGKASPRGSFDWPEGLRVIDLSADLRIADVHEHSKVHPKTGAHESLRAMARYGLVELGRESLRGARLVANPGCFATALQLALAPLVAAGLNGFVAADGKTGSSGSGAVPSETAHHPGRHSDFRAYGLSGHAHTAEVLAQFPEAGLRLSFVPHSAPMVRGIFVTVHAPRESFSGPMPGLEQLRSFYAGEPMLRVREDSPRVLDVAGTNFCDVTLAPHPDHVVVCAALDNLGKGMAGQAVQTLNLLSGQPETTGLLHASPSPI